MRLALLIFTLACAGVSMYYAVATWRIARRMTP